MHVPCDLCLFPMAPLRIQEGGRREPHSSGAPLTSNLCGVTGGCVNSHFLCPTVSPDEERIDESLTALAPRTACLRHPGAAGRETPRYPSSPFLGPTDKPVTANAQKQAPPQQFVPTLGRTPNQPVKTASRRRSTKIQYLLRKSEKKLARRTPRGTHFSTFPANCFTSFFFGPKRPLATFNQNKLYLLKRFVIAQA